MKGYFDELLVNTPSAQIKLLSVWGELSVESQLYILDRLDQNIPKSLVDKIIGDPSANEYVQYLAVKNGLLEDEKELEQKLQNKSDLVKYARLERCPEIVELPSKVNFSEKFLNLTHAARLSILRGKNCPKMDDFANSINQLFQKNVISEKEINSYFLEYLQNKKLAFRYKDISNDYYGFDHSQEEYEVLWKLILKLPVGTKYIFLTYVPCFDRAPFYFEDKIISILKQLDPWLLDHFLYRKDVGYSKLRREIFFDNGGGYQNDINVITSNDFYLEKTEFLKLLKTKNKKIEALASTTAIELVYIKALYDYFYENKDEFNLSFLRENFKHRYAALSKEQKRQEMFEVAIYNLAKKIVPWERAINLDELPEELVFLKNEIIENNTFNTYINFSNNSRVQEFHRYFILSKYMPYEYIDDFDALCVPSDKDAEFFSNMQNLDDDYTAGKLNFIGKTLIQFKKTLKEFGELFEHIFNRIKFWFILVLCVWLGLKALAWYINFLK